MKNRILALLVIIAAGAVVGLTQQPKPAATRAEPAVTSALARVPQPVSTTPAANANAVDPDQAYKANCSRCHLAPRKFPEGKIATIMRRMRVRANLTEQEAEAILRYLTK